MLQRFEYPLGPAQWQVFASPSRFRVLVAGRRFGKTQLALLELLRATWHIPGAVAWYVAPTYRQAKRIAWSRLKELAQGDGDITISETDLSIRFHSGGVIALRGADNFDSLRGNGLDFVVLDEFASMKSQVWSEVLRPALADRKGRALFIGTPQGHNHLFDRFQYAESNPGWAAFHFTTIEGGNVAPEELSDAARELDERLYRQEFEASFESTALGLVYYAYSREANVRKCPYNPRAPLMWSLDFNVHPMCSVIAQRDGDNVDVLDEIVLHDANTPLMCLRFWERVSGLRNMFMHGPLYIEVYGDASGYQRRTSGADTDWKLIRDFFSRLAGQATVHIKAATSNPGVRDRVNLVNSRLFNASGDHRLFIDPKCKELLLDFERVCWRPDALGQPTTELDKSDRMRTHVSDALGYYLSKAFPFRDTIGEKRNRLF